MFMRFIAIIPARYASTRFPGKPLAEIGGKPMIQHVYERTNAYFEYAVVATDDERIAEAVRAFGGDVVMTRTTHRSGTERCAEALNIAEASYATEFDVVVNVQGDEPFVSGDHLEKIKGAFDSADVQIATLVKKFGEGEDIFNPNSPKVVVSADWRALYFSRSPIPYIRNAEQSDWQRTGLYYKHIGLYAYRAHILREIVALPSGHLETAESLEQLRWLEHGYAITVRETTAETLAVDTPEDLERVREVLR
jgi:3-deoxy-manno-octulosonate cytidylyltransferase (CMP-KDO synthetase)